MPLIQACTDPQALNYDPTANTPCITTIDVNGATVDVVNGCCIYSYSTVLGCTDPLSPNYNPNATVDDGSCFQTAPVNDSFSQAGGSILPGPIVQNKCSISRYQIIQLSPDQEVLINGAPASEGCCSSTYLSSAIGTGTYIYSNGHCYYNTTPPNNSCPGDGTSQWLFNNSICVDSISFNNWDNNYTVSHNNQSLQISNPTLWSNLVNLINAGGSFHSLLSNYELIDEVCCLGFGQVFENGICKCETQTNTEQYLPSCVSTLEDFLTISTTTFFTQNFQTIGPSLGLSQTDTNFILANINNNNDTNGNGVPDQVEARLLLSNALNASGGIYINFGVTSNNPASVSQSDCAKISPTPGYWDGTNCMCNTPTIPPNQVVNCNLTDVQILNSFDVYNNSIQIVIQKGTTTSVSQECCLKLKNENNLSWYWENPYCYASQQTASCLPVTFNLNENEVTVEPCESGVEVYMWVYFGTPQNSCNLTTPTEETITSVITSQEITPTEITISPNTGTIISEQTTTYQPEVVIPAGTAGTDLVGTTTTPTTETTTPPTDVVITPVGGDTNQTGSGVINPNDGTSTAVGGAIGEVTTVLTRSPNTYTPQDNNKTFSVIPNTTTKQDVVDIGTNLTRNVVKKPSSNPSVSNGFLSLKLGSDTTKKTPKDDNKNQC